MIMFIVLINYKVSLDVVDKYIDNHVEFLEKCYKQNYFVVSGRKNPRTGGVILSQLKSRNQLEAILKDDPFYRHEIAEYDIIEFIPTKSHPDFSLFI